MGRYSAGRKIVNFLRINAGGSPLVNQVLSVWPNTREAHLGAVDSGGSLLARPLNLCGYLPAFSGQLYHLFSPAARNAD
jgi:hypothetical protein